MSALGESLRRTGVEEPATLAGAVGGVARGAAALAAPAVEAARQVPGVPAIEWGASELGRGALAVANWYSRWVGNPLERASLAGLEYLSGREATQRNRKWGEAHIDLIQGWKETAPHLNVPMPGTELLVPGGITWAGFFGTANMLAVDPLMFTKVLSAPRAIAAQRASATAREALMAAGATEQALIGPEGARRVLRVMEAASDPAKATALADDVERTAVEALRSRIPNVEALSEAAQSARRAIDAIEDISRRSGASADEIARNVKRAEEAAQALLVQPEATTLPGRIRAGLTAVGVSPPFAGARLPGGVRLPRAEVPLVPREAQARVAEIAGEAVRAVRRQIPERVAETARSVRDQFSVLARRSPTFAANVEMVTADATPRSRNVAEAARSVLNELSALAPKTEDDAARLMSQAARADAPENLRPLRDALRRHNETRLVERGAAGARVLRFDTGEDLARAAEGLRRTATRYREIIAQAGREVAEGNLKGAGNTIKRLLFFENVVPIETFRSLRGLGLSRQALRKIESAVLNVSSDLSKTQRSIDTLSKKRAAAAATFNRASETLERAKGTVPRVAVGIQEVDAALAEARRVAASAAPNARAVRTAVDRVVNSIERASFALERNIPTSATFKDFMRALKGHDKRVARLARNVKNVLRDLEARVSSAETKRALSAMSRAERNLARARLRELRGYVTTTKTRVENIARNAAKIARNEVRREVALRRILELDKRIEAAQKHATNALSRAISSASKATDLLGKVRVDPAPVARIMVTRMLGVPRTSKAYQPTLNAMSRYLERFMGPKRLVEIGESAFLTERVPLQMTRAALAASRRMGDVRVARAELSRRAVQVEEEFVRGKRTITPVRGNELIRGDVSIGRHIADVMSVRPHEAQQAALDAIQLVLESSRLTGISPIRILVSGGGAVRRAIEKNRTLVERMATRIGLAKSAVDEFFVEDPWTVFYRDTRRAEGQIYAASFTNRIASYYSRIPVEKIEKVDEAQVRRVVAAASEHPEFPNLVRVVIPENVNEPAKVLRQGETVAPGARLALVPRDIAVEMTRVETIFSDATAIRTLLDGYRWIVGAFRRMFTIGLAIPNPAFNVRNMLTDVYMGGQAGVEPWSPVWARASVLAGAWKRWGTDIGRDQAVIDRMSRQVAAVDEVNGITYSALTVLNDMANYGLIGRGAGMLSDIVGRRSEVMRFAATDRKVLGTSAFEVSRRFFNYLPETVADVGVSWGRIAVYLHGLENGLTPLQASLRVKSVLYDYTRLTPFERDIVRNFWLFYSWTRNNVPAQFRYLLTAPATVTAPVRLSELSIREIERETGGPVPDWIVQGMPLLMMSDDRQIRMYRTRGLIPGTDIDLYLGLLSFEEQSWREAFPEIIGGSPAMIAWEHLADVDAHRTFASGRFVERQAPSGHPVWDIFSRNVRPVSDIVRHFRTEGARPLSLVGIPVRDIPKASFVRQARMDAAERRGRAVSEVHSLIRRGDTAGVASKVEELRRASANGRAFNGNPSDALISALASNDAALDVVVAEYEKENGPGSGLRIRRMVERKKMLQSIGR